MPRVLGFRSRFLELRRSSLGQSGAALLVTEASLALLGVGPLRCYTRGRIPRAEAESQQIAARQLLYRVQHPARYPSRLQTIPSPDIELPVGHQRYAAAPLQTSGYVPVRHTRECAAAIWLVR